jgi:hypothetical protein
MIIDNDKLLAMPSILFLFPWYNAGPMQDKSQIRLPDALHTYNTCAVESIVE